jgi:hypothetical protein
MTTTDETRTNGYPQVNGRPQQTPADHDEQPATAPAPAVNSANTEPKRVQRLRAQVAEARGIVELQTDPALTEADTNRVLTERRKAAEALKLHQLGQDPARKALRDARVRRAVAFIGGTGLVGALGWSVANVQHTVVNGQHLTTADPGWWLAFLVEPVVSIGLLLIFGVRAYLAATRGLTVVDSTLRRVEASLLTITLTINSWLYLPFVAATFDPLQLLVHSVGPIVAILLVTVIPVLWGYLTDAGDGGPPADADLARWLTTARQLIADGLLPPSPSRNATEKALREHGGRISTATANRVYRCLTGNVRV